MGFRLGEVISVGKILEERITLPCKGASSHVAVWVFEAW